MYNNNSNGNGAAPARGFMARCAMLLACSVLGAVATVPSTPAHAQRFSGLGFLPGGTFSGALGVNADGTVVVGIGDATGIPFGEAFRWTQAGGMVGLGRLTGRTSSSAQGVNADGTVVVGDSNAIGTAGSEDEQAFRWTQAGGMAPLGFLPGHNSSRAQGVNADGTVVVGDSAAGTPQEAFRWTQAGGMVGLGFLPGGSISLAHAVNADGTVVVGESNATGTGAQAFRAGPRPAAWRVLAS